MSRNGRVERVFVETFTNGRAPPSPEMQGWLEKKSLGSPVRAQVGLEAEKNPCFCGFFGVSTCAPHLRRFAPALSRRRCGDRADAMPQAPWRDRMEHGGCRWPAHYRAALSWVQALPPAQPLLLPQMP